MMVTLWVNWKEKEILTDQQLNEKINEKIENALSDDECYREELKEYLNCNYSLLELFDALTGDEATMTKTIDDIKAGTVEGIRNWCKEDVRWDYDEVKVEI